MSWLMLDRIVRMGMGLFVGVWVARFLGPAQFGSLNFALAFVALFSTATTLGLDGIVIREVIHHPSDTREILGATLGLRLFAGLLSVGVTVATLRLVQPHDREALILVTILSSTLIFQAFDTIDSYFQSQVRSKYTVWAKNFAFLLFAALRVFFIFINAPTAWFAAAYAGEVAFGAVGLVFAYQSCAGNMLIWSFTFARAVSLLRQSWPLIFSGLAIMIYVRIDTVMLKVIQGDYAVGLYSAATKVSEVWYFIPTAIVSSVSPAIMRVKNDPALFYERLRRLFSLLTFISVVLGGVVAILCHTIIRILYSQQYSGAGSILAVHIWASVFVFLGVAQSPWDLAENMLKLGLYRTVAGAIVNIGMNLYLIPRYSAMGAAIATVVSYAISGVFANALHANTRPIFFLQMKSFIPHRFRR